MEELDVIAFCIAYELDLVTLQASLEERFGVGITAYPEDLTAERTPDILYAKYIGGDGTVCGDIVFFEVRTQRACTVSVTAQSASAV